MEEKGCKSSKSSCDSVPEKDEKEVEFSVNELKKNPDYLLEKKIFLPYGVGPDVDCEIDDDSDEPDYSSYVLKRPIDDDYLLKRKIFLPYGVGPDIDCEIDDDNDEPDYLSYASVPKEDLVEDSSTPRDAVP
ncbi:uncharacterized protein LOC132936264 [Metopolophium dirhodum]|uniref:uncharacterized protein LOC132936264 n=1 Tax=Metopolophium dirhodum TaxID=44670 RepID=UPI00298F9973|nr:uncharacterized protein LOC132936264 [Metopolophium dirhodum]